MLDILSPPFHSHTFLCPVLSARERAPWTAASGLLTSCSLLDFGQKEALARLSVSSESYWDHNWYNDGAQPLPSNSHSCWGFRWQRGRGGGFLAVFCGRSDGGEEYDFIIKIACTVSSFYFYMYTCHLPYASMCYCQWFPYGMFLKHWTCGSCYSALSS